MMCVKRRLSVLTGVGIKSGLSQCQQMSVLRVNRHSVGRCWCQELAVTVSALTVNRHSVSRCYCWCQELAVTVSVLTVNCHSVGRCWCQESTVTVSADVGDIAMSTLLT